METNDNPKNKNANDLADEIMSLHIELSEAQEELAKIQGKLSGIARTVELGVSPDHLEQTIQARDDLLKEVGKIGLRVGQLKADLEELEKQLMAKIGTSITLAVEKNGRRWVRVITPKLGDE